MKKIEKLFKKNVAVTTEVNLYNTRNLGGLNSFDQSKVRICLDLISQWDDGTILWKVGLSNDRFIEIKKEHGLRDHPIKSKLLVVTKPSLVKEIVLNLQAKLTERLEVQNIFNPSQCTVMYLYPET